MRRVEANSWFVTCFLWVGEGIYPTPQRGHLSLVKQSWDSEKRQVKSGRRKTVPAACKKAGIQVCEWTVKSTAREAKRQEEEFEAHFTKV